MLDHLSLGTANLERATAFYDAVLAPLGIVRVWTYPEAVGYGHASGDDELAIKQRPGFIAPGAGFHLALTARTRSDVDAFFRAALAHGGTADGAPGLRPHYGPGYYAAFVVDPDGHRLEAVCHEASGRTREPVHRVVRVLEQVRARLEDEPVRVLWRSVRVLVPRARNVARALREERSLQTRPELRFVTRPRFTMARGPR